jgi:FKBP-type peptidyl-prolyl cis-trans isomerase
VGAAIAQDKPTDKPAEKPAAAQGGQGGASGGQQMDEATRKALQEAIAKAAAQGQGQGPGGAVGDKPAGIPVPSDLPVVKTTELGDGLIAEDLKIGDGYEVKPGGAVVAHYHGTLKADGKVFDSSFNRGQPATFGLGQVIPGWQKGVPGMKVGGIRRLIIPAKLAYGDRAMGQDIPANSDLVFIIQLVDALQVSDVKEGDGEEVGTQAVSVTAFTMKDAEGKEVASATKDKPFIWVPGEMLGVNTGMEGMKVGGKRTIKVPATMNQTHPQLGDKWPQQVAVTVEVELLAVRNLAPAKPKSNG